MVETIQPSDEQPLEWHEMAPGTVLRGLFRTNRSKGQGTDT